MTRQENAAPCFLIANGPTFIFNLLRPPRGTSDANCASDSKCFVGGCGGEMVLRAPQENEPDLF